LIVLCEIIVYSVLLKEEIDGNLDNDCVRVIDKELNKKIRNNGWKYSKGNTRRKSFKNKILFEDYQQSLDRMPNFVSKLFHDLYVVSQYSILKEYNSF